MGDPIFDIFDRRSFFAGLAASAAGLWAVRAEAALDPCQAFYGKGYCTDYVNSRISPRQGGDGGSWPSNMPGSAVQAGDVAIFRAIQHVAYVEEVTGRGAGGEALSVRVSEMNYARGVKPGTPTSCLVTPNFGVRTTRVIAVSSAEFMRPGGYRALRMAPPQLRSRTDDRTAGSTPKTNRR